MLGIRAEARGVGRRRRWFEAAVAAVALVAIVGAAGPAAAQADGIGDQLISSLPGFQSNATGLDGPLDAALMAQVGVLGGQFEEAADDLGRAIEGGEVSGFLRSFADPGGTFVLVMGFGPVPSGDAGDFTEGMSSQLGDVESVPSPTGDDRIAAISGTMPGLGPALIAGLISDDLAVAVLVAGPGLDAAFDLAVGAQAARTPPTRAADGGESAAQRLGRAVAPLLVVGIAAGLAVLLVVRSRQGRTPAAAGYSPPGAWPPAPPTGPTHWPPPPTGGFPLPPTGTGPLADPWATPTSPPLAPPTDPPSADGPAPIE